MPNAQLFFDNAPRIRRLELIGDYWRGFKGSALAGGACLNGAVHRHMIFTTIP
jgi:hypothetical protein